LSHPRTVQQVLPARETLEGAGVTVFRTIGSPILDEFTLPDPDTSPGLPWHPHRGFETVSYLLEGSIHHQDQAGGEGLLEPGDVQWMTAGSGIVHQEMPVPGSGPCRGLQLWVNLPSAHKGAAPRYQEYKREQLPLSETDGCSVRVIAGSYQELSGVIETTIPITFLDISLAAGHTFNTTIDSSLSLFCYVLEGSGEFGEQNTLGRERTLLTFSSGDVLTVLASTALRFLCIAGRPIEEPVCRYGPFVMNSQAEIIRAIKDYQQGRLMQ
jgi:redox-sensitive bicupin YhaK (pirin superfamily)